VEELLERAREAVTAQDAKGADSAVAEADALLHAHAALPQAAWLLAEVERTRASRYRRLLPPDARRGAEAWARAAALDGGRAAGLGEDAPPGAQPALLGKPSVVRLVLDEGAPFDRGGMDAQVDGVRADGGTLAAPPGEHQVVVSRDGAPVWAAWVTFGRDVEVLVAPPGPAPCSRADVTRARVGERVKGGVDAAGVRCDSWVAAKEADDRGTILLATCAGDVCGPVVSFRVGPPGPAVPSGRGAAAAWPTWATWAVVGGGLVAAAGVTLAATGTFRSTQAQPVFTTGGLHPASFPPGLRFPP
jgi:hypothetical protein